MIIQILKEIFKRTDRNGIGISVLKAQLLADRPVGLQLGSYFTVSPFRQMVMSTPIMSNPTFFH